MKEDNEGFHVPQINEKYCTDCGVCVSQCPQNTNLAYNKCIKVLGARYKDDAVLSKSASGGVFAGIAKYILDIPGSAVFGCALNENIVACHIAVYDFANIEPLQNSKYVQSDVGDSYKQSKLLLDDKNIVFYSGTPCQIAGLYAFLGRDYSNLLTADLICHGVPSPLLFKKYIIWLSKKYNEKISSYSFRCKEKNNKSNRGIVIKTKTKTKTQDATIDPYFCSFLSNKTLRECCYKCKYTNSCSPADITLGDFWGIEKAHPGFSDRRGVSVVLINTLKGEELTKKIRKNFSFIDSTFEIAASENVSLKKPHSRHALRDTVYKEIHNESIDIFKTRPFRVNYVVVIAKKVLKKCYHLVK